MAENQYIVGYIDCNDKSGTRQFTDYSEATSMFVSWCEWNSWDSTPEIDKDKVAIKSVWIDSVAGVRLAEWRMG